MVAYTILFDDTQKSKKTIQIYIFLAPKERADLNMINGENNMLAINWVLLGNF